MTSPPGTRARSRSPSSNVDDNQQTAQTYGIRGIPTLLVFKGGKVVEQIIGAVPKSRLEESFKKHG